jgi:hypothetical protein
MRQRKGLFLAWSATPAWGRSPPRGLAGEEVPRNLALRQESCYANERGPANYFPAPAGSASNFLILSVPPWHGGVQRPVQDEK